MKKKYLFKITFVIYELEDSAYLIAFNFQNAIAKAMKVLALKDFTEIVKIEKLGDVL